MARTVTDFAAVRDLALELGARVSPDAVRVDGQLAAWIPPRSKKEVEPGTMAVRVPIEEREGMIADAPEIYYVTNHYLRYPVVLVRLARISPDALKDLVRAAVAGKRA